ncbi:DUF4148 domain-containing protein [Caballeronia sp. BR00000012568055]|uniref:DUF4148 domain-containing protein n=1 Tax=Caballeronia sp. BR00000012568055 TaxID=2918761 RepID=UPI0023F8C2CC|nr:DUF4148 domain-containing protein [Caballeronia sp. BR00000012568055]
MKTAFLLAACAFSASAFAQTGMMNDQPMQGAAQMPMASNGPVTRAQVRADLARARVDGTIPRFGNPDPYGPARSSRNSPLYPPR